MACKLDCLQHFLMAEDLNNNVQFYIKVVSVISLRLRSIRRRAIVENAALSRIAAFLVSSTLLRQKSSRQIALFLYIQAVINYLANTKETQENSLCSDCNVSLAKANQKLEQI